MNKDEDVKKLLEMLETGSRLEKATLKLDNRAMKCLNDYIKKLESKAKKGNKNGKNE